MRIVIPECEEVHVLPNGNTLLVNRVVLTAKESSLIIDQPYYNGSYSYWFSTPLGQKEVPLIKSVEIIKHEESAERFCGSFTEIIEKNIGKNVVITKKRFINGNKIEEKIEGKIAEKKGTYVKLETKENIFIIIAISDIDEIRSAVSNEKLDLVYQVPSLKEKMKVNYECKKDCVVFLTYVERGLSVSPSYRVFLDEVKKEATLKLEFNVVNHIKDLNPKNFHFHFGNPKFLDDFALSANRNLFVLNPLTQGNHIPYIKTRKDTSVCYMLENITIKNNTQILLPVFEEKMKFEKVFSCSLYLSNGSIPTSKILRVKNNTKTAWVDAPVVISSTEHLVKCRSNIPFTKEGSICEVYLKTSKALKVFYKEEIEKICQIKQKQGAVVGEVIVEGKVSVKNIKERTMVIVLKYEFPGTYNEGTVKPHKMEDIIVNNDLNPKNTKVLFSLAISEKSKKKKFSFKYTKWTKQDALENKIKGAKLNSFFQQNEKNLLQSQKAPQLNAINANVLNDDAFDEEIDVDYSSGEEFIEEENCDLID